MARSPLDRELLVQKLGLGWRARGVLGRGLRTGEAQLLL